MKFFKDLFELLKQFLIIFLILSIVLIPLTLGVAKISIVDADSQIVKTLITIIDSAIISLSISFLINRKIEETRKKDLASGILSYAFGVVLPKELSEELGKSIEKSRIIRKNVRIYIDINLSSNTKKIIVSIVFNAELDNITSTPQEYTDRAYLEPTDNSMRMNHEPIIVFTNNKGDELESEYKYENRDGKQIDKTLSEERIFEFNNVPIKFCVTLLDINCLVGILFIRKFQAEYRPVKITKKITIEPSQYINHYKKITLESERTEYFSDNYVLPYPMIGIDLYISYPQDYQVILWQAMSSQMKDLSKLKSNSNENNQKNHQVYSTKKAILANNGFTIEVFKKNDLHL